MKHFIATLMAALGLAACADSHLQQSQVVTSAEDAGIVGGAEAKMEDPHADFVVMIRGKYADGRNYICTGSVIDKDIILTAAHCIGEQDSMQIIFGADPLKTGATQLAKVKDLYKHDHYNKYSQVRNDIALIQLDEEIPPYFEMAELPWRAEKKLRPLKWGDKIKTYGFGVTSGVLKNGKVDSRTVGVLRLVNLNFLELSHDKDAFFVDQTHDKGICSGDSGGPAFRYNNVTVGITSYAITDDPQALEASDDDVCNFKSVFTNVIYYKDWIIKGIAILHAKKAASE